MDKEILRHREFMQTKLERLASERRGKQQSEQLWLLWRYHHYQVQNFQHERQIHLLVTITFGLIMLGGWAGLLGWLVVTGGSFDTVTWLIIARNSIFSFFVRLVMMKKSRIVYEKPLTGGFTESAHDILIELLLKESSRRIVKLAYSNTLQLT